MKTVLVIEDDKFSQKFIAKALASNYDITLAGNGTDGLQAFQNARPDIILLDVETPGLNGYEVCDRIRQDDPHHTVPIVFLSGRSSVRERMLGYEAGGDDYMVKPFEQDELLAKLSVLLKHQSNRQKLEVRADEAEQTALVAMAGNAELGAVLSFAERSFSVRAMTELAEEFFRVTRRLGLNCSLYINTAYRESFFSARGEVAPLEEQLMRLLKPQGRIVDFGARTQINYEKIALLIKNMPLDDMEKYGRYKDLFPFMLESAEAKVTNMEAEEAMFRQTKNILGLYSDIEKSMTELAHNLEQHTLDGQQILIALREELDARIPTLGLDDDQESYFIKRIDDAVEQAVNAGDSRGDVKTTADNVLTSLRRLINHQKQIIDTLILGRSRETTEPSPQAAQTSEPNDELDGGGMDIELF